MTVLTYGRRVRCWHVRCIVDGRETRFEAATREEALDVARRFAKAFGAAASTHVVRTERITPLP